MNSPVAIQDPQDLPTVTDEDGLSESGYTFSDDSDVNYEDERNVRPVWHGHEQLSLRDVVSLQSAPDFMPPHRLALAKVKKARTAEDFWKSNKFNLLGLPFVDASLRSHTVDDEQAVLWGTLNSAAWSTKKERRGDTRARTRNSRDQILFSRCCACAGRYEYDIGDGNLVYICSGFPDGDYVAISYVWGPVRDLVAICVSCDYVSLFPMESEAKFKSITALAGRGSCVWLDALSIDQGDHTDIAQQVSSMGSIYKNARNAVVLLPDSDLKAFDLLQRLSRLAKAILERPAHFHLNYEDAEAEIIEHLQQRNEEFNMSVGPLFWSVNPPYYPSYDLPRTSELCNDFHTTFYEFQKQLPNFRYWQRAWTFQEWSLAQDIDIGIGESKAEKVKTLIFSAASLICQYRLALGEYSKIKLDLTTDEAIAFFGAVKQLFPLEDVVQVQEEVSIKEQRRSMRMAATLGDNVLGLRKTPRTESEAVSTRIRLRLMLDAFSLNKREAKYPADLVACWASMCNIQYAYNRNDSLVFSLFKVKNALRRTGMQIFDFIPAQMDTGQNSTAPRQPSFFAYAAQHVVSNATTDLLYPGMSIFTGRTDTFVHIAQILLQDLNLLGDINSPVTLHFVTDAFPKRKASLLGSKAAAGVFRKTVLGESDRFMFHDQTQMLLGGLAQIPDSLKRFYDLWQFYLPTAEGAGASRKILKAWTLIPQFLPFEAVKVARESGTGAIVALTITKSTTPIVAYLLITDQFSGTHILRSDPNGLVDISLEVPMRRGIMAAFPDGRQVDDVHRLQCQLHIDATPIMRHAYKPTEDPLGDIAVHTRKQRTGTPEIVTMRRRRSN